VIARRGFFAISAALLCAALIAPPTRAQFDEHAVRAAYIYNLTKYVAWPRTKGEITIGLVGGGGGMEEALMSVVNGKVVDGRRLRVVPHPVTTELKRCDIVYIANATLGRSQNVLGELHGLPTLTVGADDHFIRAGGMIGMIRTGDQIQLEINPEAALSAGLHISSRLLNIAIITRIEKKG
jgi:hypothetical protein